MTVIGERACSRALHACDGSIYRQAPFGGDGSLTMQLGDFLTAVQARKQMADAFALDGPVNLAEALKKGTPNRRTIALQMVKDVLDESSFEASPGHAIPEVVGKLGRSVTDKLVRGSRQTDR
jgi:hypothetical protein